MNDNNMEKLIVELVNIYHDGCGCECCHIIEKEIKTLVKKYTPAAVPSKSEVGLPSLLGIPVVENALLQNGTAFLMVQNKGVVTQMLKIYDESEHSTPPDEIEPLEKLSARKGYSFCIGYGDACKYFSQCFEPGFMDEEPTFHCDTKPTYQAAEDKARAFLNTLEDKK